MPTFDEILKKKPKEWNAPNMMNMATAPRGNKLPFSSPQMNYCPWSQVPQGCIQEIRVPWNDVRSLF